MPLHYDVTGRWRSVGRDTVELLIEYHVIGDVEATGQGYPAYRIVERIAVDTVELTATRAEDGSVRYTCSADTRLYFSRTEAEVDPGLFANESEFLRLLSVADSILDARGGSE
jgi:hypothetical protein